MSRMRLTMLAAVAVMMIGGTHDVIGQPKGERVTVKGEVVDMWCYLEGGDRGPAKKQCATMCAKAGNPIGLLDDKGNLYLTAGLKDHQPAQTLLIDKMSEQVTVTGTLVKKGGTQMIYIDAVK